MTRRVLTSVSRPTALVYDNDVMAAAGAAVVADVGLTVPGDMSVASWKDSVLCRMVHPFLTALSRDPVTFGRIAAQELAAPLDSGAARSVLVSLPELIEGESTAPPR